MHTERGTLAEPSTPSPAAPALLDLAASQAAWWWCVLLVRAGHSELALLGPLAYLAGRAWASRGEGRATLTLAAAGAAFGIAGDQALVLLGLLDFSVAGTRGGFMVALWAMFAATLRFSAGFVTRLGAPKRAALGALAGPLAYAGGERLGVLDLRSGGLLGVGLEWAVALLLLPLLVLRRPAAGATP